VAILSDGNVGIGTTSPGSILTLGSGQISVPAGSAAAPSYSFSGELGTGIYKSSSGFLGFSGNGVAGVFMGSTPNTPVTGITKVIALSGAIDLGNFGDNYLYRSATGNMILQSNGNVGIGNTTPSNRLDVVQSGQTAGIRVSGGTNPQMKLEGTTAQAKLQVCDSCSGGLNDVGSGIGLFGTENAYPFAIYTNNSERVRITSTGNVGIGSTGPTARLQIVGADDLSTSFAAKIGGATTTGLVVQNNGNVGIGTASPGNKLEVTSAGIGGVRLKDTASDTNSVGGWDVNAGVVGISHDGYSIYQVTPGLTRFAINDNGNVGIGIATPTAYLDIAAGTASAGSAPLKFTSSAGALLTASEAGAVEYNGTHLYFTATNGGTRYQLDQQSASNLPIGTTNNSTLRWNSGTSAWAENTNFKVDTTGNVTGGTYNGLTLTSASDGFTAAGGTTPRTLTVTGGNFTVNNTGNNTLTMTASASLNQNLLTTSAPSFAGLTLTGAMTLKDDQLLKIGTSGSGVIMNRSASLTANTALANVFVGTPVVGAIVANSTVFSNITSGSDMIFATNIGGNSTELMRLSGTTSQVAIGTGAASLTIDNNGQVGIGTVTPGYILDVQAASSKINSKNGYLTNGADYAEYFYTDNTDLVSGEAVCVDMTKPNAVKRCDRSGDNNVMGIVSTNPSIVGNGDGVARDNDPHYKIIGMIGQVSGKINNENGAVAIGDSLTASATAGYLRKANAGESTVGIAMQNMSDALGNIQVLISRRNQSLTVEKVEESVTQNIAAMNIQDQVNKMIANAQTALQAQTESLVLKTDQNVTDLLGLQTSVDANLTIIAGRLDTNEKNIAILQDQTNTLTNTENSNAAILKDLQTQMDLIKTQNQAVIDFAIALNTKALIYKDVLGNIDLGDGKLEAGGIVAGAFTVKVTDEGKKTIGSNYIEVADSTNDGQSYFIKTTAVTDTCVILSNFQANPNAYSWVEKIKDSNGNYIGFKIHLSQPTAQRIYFDWWIVEKDDKTQKATAPTVPTPTITTAPTDTHVTTVSSIDTLMPATTQ